LLFWFFSLSMSERGRMTEIITKRIRKNK